MLGEISFETGYVVIYTGLRGRPAIILRNDVAAIPAAADHPDVEFYASAGSGYPALPVPGAGATLRSTLLKDGRMTVGEISTSAHRNTTLLRGALVALVAFVVLKFLVLLADVDWDIARSPFVPLVLVIAFAALLWRSAGRRKWAAIVALVLFAAFAVIVVSALVRDGLARQSWADYPFAYGGLTASAVGGLAAWRLARDPRQSSG